MTDGAALETLGDDMRIFVDRVRVEAALDRGVDAEVLARAVMRALGEQAGAEQAGHLTAGLPEELVAEVTAWAGEPPADFDRGAFLDRVGAELDGVLDGTRDRDTVDRHVHAVLTVVREWAPDGQLEGTLAQLPSALAAMFA